MTPPATTKRRFAWIWLTTTVLSLVAVALINRVIDPYGLYAWPRWQGVNLVKPRPQRSLADIKLINALRQKPDALILGNSRADIGFDPKVLINLGLAERPFNLAVPGSGLATNLGQLETLLEHGVRPKHLVVGIEFFDYLQPDPPATGNSSSWSRRELRLQLQSLLTLTALGDSLTTLVAQRATNEPTVRDDGFNPMQDYAALAAREGYFALFRQRGLENARRLKDAQIPSDWRQRNDFTALESLLRLAATNDIRTDIIIYPYHAQVLGLFRHFGLLTRFEDWKRAIALLVSSQGGASRSGHHLWDFACINDYTTESIPPAGETRRITQWYWEAGHFKSELGTLLLNEIFSNLPSSQPTSASSLRCTESQNLDESLSTTWRARTDLKDDIDSIAAKFPYRSPVQ